MRALRRILPLVGLLALVACGTAYALSADIGATHISATATLLPRTLPKQGGAPITLSSVTRIGTSDGSPPPGLTKMVFLLDKHGSIETKGVPVCTMAKLEGTTPALARKRCGGALVGEGTGKAEVNLPGHAPMEISSPISFFNAPPVGGNPSLIAHAYETVPTPKTLLVPIVIERVKHGRYGFQAQIELPEIAGGYGSPTLAEATLGHTFKRGGKPTGYINAYCSGGRLQVHGTLSFSDGDFFPATLTSPCHSPG
ncbi:MAG: hypothetical protein H0X42_02595 [Solirubrobacterales bacterium]|nr:hypothetical protein [Solirubrobacterales bacterium]